MNFNLMNITALTFIASSAAVLAQADFASFDQNRNNIITEDEYLDVIMAPFDRLDTNADGWLSQEELLVTARQRAEGTRRKPRKMVSRLLERYDSNADNRLSALELGLGGTGEFFNRYDQNLDGAITLAEWQSRSETPTTAALDRAETGPSEPTETTPEAPESSTSPGRERVPTGEREEPTNDNSWKMDQTPDITDTQPMTGNWLFDLRP